MGLGMIVCLSWSSGVLLYADSRWDPAVEKFTVFGWALNIGKFNIIGLSEQIHRGSIDFSWPVPGLQKIVTDIAIYKYRGWYVSGTHTT